MNQLHLYQRPWAVSAAGLDRVQIHKEASNTHRQLASQAKTLIDRLNAMQTVHLFVK